MLNSITRNMCPLMNVIKNAASASGSFTMRLVKPIGDQSGGIYIYATALGYVLA